MNHKRKESLSLAEHQTNHVEAVVTSCLDTVVIMELLLTEKSFKV